MEAIGDRRQQPFEIGRIPGKARSGRLELQAHEEAAGIEVGILLAVEDEAVVVGERRRHRRDDADGVFAVEGKDIAVGHQ